MKEPLEALGTMLIVAVCITAIISYIVMFLTVSSIEDTLKQTSESLNFLTRKAGKKDDDEIEQEAK